MFSRQRQYSDTELIEMMQRDGEALGIVYRQHREYALRFLEHSFQGLNHEDIFHDAVLVLYEKVCVKGGFELSSSIQTYLNSVCRNMALKQIRREEHHLDYEADFLEEIADELDPIEDEHSSRMQAIVKAIEMLKAAGGKCYDLLTRFYFLKQRFEQIAYEMEYTNADNAKNQKARCQRRLKILTFNFLRA